MGLQGRLDGRKITAGFDSPSNYTPSPAGNENVNKVSAHLKGIDDALGSSGGGGFTELEITQWNEDDTESTSNATLWGAQTVIRFDEANDTAVWFSFEMPDSFINTSDITFRLNYSITTNGTSGDAISLNLTYCVVADGETPDFNDPDGTKEDEIDVSSVVGNQSNYLNLTNIKIDNADIPSGNCRIIGKLWRDVDGASQNYANDFDLISLVAKQ